MADYSLPRAAGKPSGDATFDNPSYVTKIPVGLTRHSYKVGKQ